MKYIITEEQNLRLRFKRRSDKIDESTGNNDDFMELIHSFIIHIYGKELTQEDDKDRYLRFYSNGPKPPFERNGYGRLWMIDDRLVNLLVDFASLSMDEALELISQYFRRTYNIKIMDIKFPSHVFPGNIDYSNFDDKL
jgi:hypothetical protein